MARHRTEKECAKVAPSLAKLLEIHEWLLTGLPTTWRPLRMDSSHAD